MARFSTKKSSNEEPTVEIGTKPKAEINYPTDKMVCPLGSASVDNGLPNFVIVLGLGIHSFRAAMKRNTAITFRDVLAILDVKPERFFKCKRSDFSIAKTLASGNSSAF